MKKWLHRIAMGTFALFALLYGFVFLRSVIPVTIHDEELQMARASIPQGSNAFDVLQEAGNQVWWPKDQDRQISNLANNTNWDDALASMILASNRQALASWDAAAKMPDLQVPEIFNCEDSLPYLRVWKELAQLAGARENFLLHHGQEQEAFDQMVRQIQLGRRMQNAHGVLIVYLVGTAVHNVGLTQMQRWAGKTHLTPSQLKDYIRQLEPQPDKEAAAFASTVRADYHSMIGTIEAFRQGKIHDLETGGNYPRPQQLRSVLPVFNFNKTKALFVKPYLVMLKAAPHHYNEVKLPDMDSQPSKIVLMLSGNVVGQILYDMVAPAVASCLVKKSQANVSLQATRTILALRAYQLAHGSLPADLNALVPEFLDKVPVDDFDGQPLRYSSERKIVYSVGKNLKDDGGDDRESKTDFSQRHLDLVFQFDF
jgi:hypothetical protein